MSSLASGMRLGPYELFGLIGKGGMGEVYKAKDMRLDRTVAIKILQSNLTVDPDRRARFEREAKTIASLSHPQICTLHDVGEYAGSMFLVMEHLDGETLAHRLEKGPVPIKQALAIATEIADALSAAHRHGVIHRDLKPGNVMLTKAGAKLLDFGLAKLAGHGDQAGVAHFVSAATRSAPLTAEGVILGTLQYMAPEQVEAKPSDARTDLWALGAILYEMVTGTRAFEAGSAASLMVAILDREPPPLTTFKPLTPPAVDRIVRQCLSKSPDDRPDTAHDVANDLRWVQESGSTATLGGDQRSSWRRALVFVPVLVLAMVGGAVVGYQWRPDRMEQQASVHSSLVMAETAALTSPEDVAISSDGRMVVFRASDGARPRLYLRRLDDRTATPLEGTEDAFGACFSPEGDAIAFASAKGLLRLRLDGGPPVTIFSDALAFRLGMEWEPDGDIIFSRGSRVPGLWRIQVKTGQLSQVVKPEAAGIVYLWPRRLPGTQLIMFTRQEQGRLSIAMLRPGSSTPDTLIARGSHARFIPATGHLVYQDEGNLFAVRFDPQLLTLSGEPVLMIRGVGNTVPLVGEYDVSATGTLVYLPPARASVAWHSRDGVAKSLGIERLGFINYVALSPDGRRAVLGVRDGGSNQLLVADSIDGVPRFTRLTSGNNDWFGVFTRDGRRLLITSPGTDNRFNIYSIPMDKSGEAVRQTNSATVQRASSVGPGDVFLFNDVSETSDVWQQQLDRPDTARRVLSSPAREAEASFSPDGRWIVYESDLDGRPEIYVRRYPDGPARVVSPDGGQRPIWGPSGREVFFQKSTSVFAVTVIDGAPSGSATHLFDRPEGRDRNWDVAADGMRFLVAEHIRPARINVVTNWLEELRLKAPAR